MEVSMSLPHAVDKGVKSPNPYIPVLEQTTDTPSAPKPLLQLNEKAGIEPQLDMVPITDSTDGREGEPTPEKRDQKAENSSPEPTAEQEVAEEALESETASNSDGSTLEAGHRQRRRSRSHSARRRRRMIKEAETRFSRKNGIVYIADESWDQYRYSAINCHLYVSLMSTEKPILKGAVDVFAKGNGTESIQHTSIEKEKGGKENTPDPTISPSGTLPQRVRIMNQLLYGDISRICLRNSSYQSINYDQVAPFRTLIPFEQEFRKRHKELEVGFATLANEHPHHPAVQRTDSYLPVRFARLVDADDQLDDEVLEPEINISRILLDGYRALIHLLDTDLRELVESYRQIQAGTAEKLPFSHLWFLFTPGQEIITKQPKYQAYRVLQVTGGRRSLRPRSSRKGPHATLSNLVIDCFHLDYDGINFGPVPVTLSIKPYEGVKKITILPTYPLQWSKDIIHNEKEEKSLSEYLEERGKKFEELVKVSHRRYKGLTLREGQLFDSFEEIDSDVMIDFELAYRSVKIPMPEFGGGVIASPTEEDEAETHSDGVSYDDRDYLKSKSAQWADSTDLLRDQTPGAIPKDSYTLLPARVYGYVLLSRRWYPLDVDAVEQVPKAKPGENDGFQKLVLPNGHREIVRALIQTHARKLDTDRAILTANSEREFDLVKGKGRGLIILLHGAPGVGKTSTAECVAANAGKPLFPITCGDIGGDSAQEVEDNLDGFFDLARKWDCVLLLDEADVFLSAREAGNIRQNSLVSVFLRVLEYYPGILILTTNRVGSFDEAIKSRVHCALYYPKLNEERTFRVWQMNIQTLKDRNSELEPRLRVQFDEKEIEAFAKRHWKRGERTNRWNGRQIKNAFQTAVALADWDSLQVHGGDRGPELKAIHFKKVAKASKHFDKYLAKTRRDDDWIAKEKGIRDDSMTLDSLSESSDEEEELKKSKRKSSSKTDKKSKKTPTKKSKSVKGKSKSNSKGKRKTPETSSSSEQESSSESSSEGKSSDESSDESESVDEQQPRSSKKTKKHKI